MPKLRLNKILIHLGLIVILLLQINVEAEENIYKALLKPSLKFKTLPEYEAQCKESGIMLDSDFVMMFAPKAKTKEAKIIFRYLVKAYDELHRIVGRHTEYKIVVYHFPENNKDGWGGTGNCEIGYDYRKLDLASQKEWQKYKVPHVSGYIEEMAHSFVHATKTQFGWEMVGWSIGIQATKKVAKNPIFLKSLQNTRENQKTTFNNYKKGGYIFPKDLPENQCDRIYGYLLWRCERKYGRNFWPDFFEEIRKEYANLRDADKLAGSYKKRNKQYQISVDCFDRLDGLDFKNRLKTAKISLTADVRALRPEEPGWDRKFISSAPVVDTNTLPPLHKAVYGGHSGETKKLIQEGAALNERGANGWTPLHLAAIGGHELLSKYLLNEGADIAIKDKAGRSAAKLAEIFGHEELAKFLREQEKH